MNGAPSTLKGLLRAISDSSDLRAEVSGAKTQIRCPQDHSLIAVIPAKIKNPHTLNNIWSQVRHHLREHPADATLSDLPDDDPVGARLRARGPAQGRALSSPTGTARAPYLRGDLLGLRLRATVGSVGMDRRERVRNWARYAEVYAERFHVEPDLDRGTDHRHRPVFGRCPECHAPEDSFCYPSCSKIDRLDTR